MSDVIGTMTLSIDDDGFLRRQCPYCGQEFKWLHSEEGELMPDGGYHCPYCNERSEDGWWTRPQLAHIESLPAGHAEDMLDDSLNPLELSSSDFVKISVNPSPRESVPPVPDEPNDMRRVEFDCHLMAPVKVVETWNGPVHCLLCGQTA